MTTNIQPMLLVALVVAGTLGWATPSRADLIATPIFDNTTKVGTLGSHLVANNVFVAQGFQTGTNAMALHRVSLLLENLNATTNFSVKLYAASGGLPSGTPIQIYSGTPGLLSFSSAFVTPAAPLASPFATLAANTSYFISVENGGVGSGVSWRSVSPDTTLGRAQRNPSSAPSWSSMPGPELMMKLEQFEDVAAVPEPGSVLFASLVGGGGLLVRRWRRRKG